MFNLTYKEILSTAILLGVIGLLGLFWQKPWQALGSVEVGNSYRSTTTPQVASGTNLCPQSNYNLASSTTGTLGSVNITSVGTSRFRIVDATTTDATKRAVAATTSLLLADFPIGASNGSYHYDVEFKNGLLVDTGLSSSGTGISTSTISYRCGS